MEDVKVKPISHDATQNHKAERPKIKPIDETLEANHENQSCQNKDESQTKINHESETFEINPEIEAFRIKLEKLDPLQIEAKVSNIIKSEPDLTDPLYFEISALTYVKSETRSEIDENLNCNICEKLFGSKVLLKKHEKSHKEMAKVACDQCGKFFPKQVHNKILKCEKCDKVCKGSVRLYNHKYRVHGKKCPCTICGKAFASKISLERHDNVMHKKLSIYKCNLCDKSFKYYEGLKSHIEMVHQGMEFQCDQCQLTFAGSLKLHYHKRSTHFKTKNFGCDICEKRFERKRSIIAHMVDEHAFSIFKCDICHREFNSLRYLQDHSKTVHIPVDEKISYSCHICDKTFFHHKSLKRHKRESHFQSNLMPKVFHCDKCGKTFTTPPGLKYHNKTKHQI